MKFLRHRDYFPSAASLLAVDPHMVQWDNDLHRHEFSELVVVTSCGTGIHVVDGEGEWDLRVGDVFVIDGARVHRYRKAWDLELMNILYVPAALRSVSPKVRQSMGYRQLFSSRTPGLLGHLQLVPEELQAVKRRVYALANALQGRERRGLDKALGLFGELVEFISAINQDRDRVGMPASTRIDQALAFMESHSSEKVRLKQVADAVGLSTRSLVRLFRKGVGRSPIDHLITLRIEAAKELLKDARLTVTDVAYRTGFWDSNYFARQFRRVTGSTPTGFRERNRVPHVRHTRPA